MIKRELTVSLAIFALLAAPASLPAASGQASQISLDSPFIQVSASKKSVSRQG